MHLLDSAATVGALVKLGFIQTDKNTKTIKFKNEHLTVFVKVKTLRQPLVIHPENQVRFGELEAIRGVVADLPMRFYHNSTMRAFPSRLNTGKSETKYGIAFGFDDERSLRDFVQTLLKKTPSSLLDDLDSVNTDAIGPTEKLELKKSRIGQGRFRDDLIEEFKGICPVTDVNRPDLLRASHIKPWRDCTNIERLDKNNGLLLAVNVDALFDRGYISFDDSGKILVSNLMGREGIAVFGLKDDLQIDLLEDARKSFIKYHRKEVFLK
jgi:putative restriction endonuclease